MIGSPVHDFRVNVRFCHAIADTRVEGVRRGMDVQDFYIGGDSLVQNARNDIVRQALVSGYDDLIFIDADQDWEPEWVFRLLSYPVDCVGAPVRKKADDRELYNIRLPSGIPSFRGHPGHKILTAPGMSVGTGFIRFSRKALQALWDTSEAYRVMGKEEARWIFDVRPVNGLLVGEDTLVSAKLNKVGIDVWIDPEMNPGHMGEKRWEGNFLAYIAGLTSDGVLARGSGAA